MSRHVPRGDSHHFGRRVEVGATRVQKPRTVAWERLLLAARSPLRRALEEAGRAGDLGPGAFAFLPSLRFFPSRDPHGGIVERLRLAPVGRLSATGRLELARVVGRALALFAWLGVGDLHWENLALGRDGRGRLVFGPLDVELIFADMALPTETKLLPDPDPEVAAICQHAAGIRRALPFLGKPVTVPVLLAVVAAYRAALDALDARAPELAEAVASVPGLEGEPIRVCLRGTDAYVRARTEPVWPPLLDAEAEQLVRGDIPYFFRLLEEPGIRWYTDANMTIVKRLPTRGDVPRLEPLLSLARKLRSSRRKRLRDEGLFTVVGALDHPGLSGTHATDEGLAVRFGARGLVVTLPDGEELEARRDLSAFVASAYQPCRCGEVRTALVPPVTRCTPVDRAFG